VLFDRDTGHGLNGRVAPKSARDGPGHCRAPPAVAAHQDNRSRQTRCHCKTTGGEPVIQDRNAIFVNFEDQLKDQLRSTVPHLSLVLKCRIVGEDV
jgi:hypothetical protein